MASAPDAPAGLDTLAASLFPESGQLAIDGGPVSVSLIVGPMAMARVTAALESGDPAALFSCDHDFAPFWCPRCGASYCGEHFLSFPVFDHGYYDYTKGICPSGHEWNLED